jgi:hypothetical protein
MGKDRSLVRYLLKEASPKPLVEAASHEQRVTSSVTRICEKRQWDRCTCCQTSDYAK